MEKHNSADSLSSESSAFLRREVASAMPDYEVRDPQVAMMTACAKTIEKGGSLLVEAGTGTGKTFAYLIPIILSGVKAIISTRTINLQEQIASKDLAFLSKIKPFDYAIAKGRANYLCLRRLNAFRTDDPQETEEYKILARWSSGTKTGDIEDYEARRSLIWERVSSDADACKGNRCPFYKKCFYYFARGRWEEAQIVVANHALVGINAMFHADSKILPQAEALILDEAHALDGVLSEVAGITLSQKGFERALNRFLRTDERGLYKGILSQSPDLFPVIEALRSELSLFWVSARNRLKHRTAIKGEFSLRDFALSLADSIFSASDRIKNSTLGLFHEDDELEMRAGLIKLHAFAEGLKAFAEGEIEDNDNYVRWAEIEERRTALRMSPVYPRDFVRQSLRPDFNTVLLTSATLSVSGDFGFIKNLLGFDDTATLSLSSPFDLKNMIEVKVFKGVNHKEADSAEKLAEAIIEEASRKDGGLLALFTSRDVMNRTWERSIEALSSMGLNPLMQGELPNSTLLEIMRDSTNTVLFGLDSFWEGVDVKGDALKSIVITKLPFEVPTEPIVQARTEVIEKQGGNSFYEYSLPKAVLKFKQGFGRLIRSKTDSGRIIICDDRIETKMYGRKFREVYK
ncbi:MAG: ATP-dependent DNA helicase [Nitrospirae bacterium]|nr:MAG: ATP-dependent DNA helicase [Nitrospirota bacterium]